MDEQKVFYRILNDVCKEKGIEQKLLSYDWIIELKKEEKVHHIIRYQFDLNSSNAYKIAKDKYATFAILKENKVPMIEHIMVFNPKTRSAYFDEDYMFEINRLLEQNKKIVIKANDSSQGKDVFCALDKNEAQSIINKLFEEYKDSLSICPYVEIDYEYRVVVLDGQILFIYKKKKPYVIGDGKNNIQNLIQNKYKDFANISLDKNLDLNYIPVNEEEITISWKHNLNNGAEPVLVFDEEENIERIKEIALQAAKVIDIKFATIDIALTTQKELTVVEINGSVCMNKFAELVPNGYEIAKDIYAKAIDKMFE